MHAAKCPTVGTRRRSACVSEDNPCYKILGKIVHEENNLRANQLHTSDSQPETLSQSLEPTLEQTQKKDLGDKGEKSPQRSENAFPSKTFLPHSRYILLSSPRPPFSCKQTKELWCANGQPLKPKHCLKPQESSSCLIKLGNICLVKHFGLIFFAN